MKDNLPINTLTVSQSACLDGLRYFAAMLVLCSHLMSHFYAAAYLPYRETFHTNLGGLGVAIFFVLSGFLIAYTVSRKSSYRDDYDLWEYLIERFTRIYIVLAPVLFIALAARLAGMLMGIGVADHPLGGELGTSLFSARHFFATLFMLQGVRGIVGPFEAFSMIDPAWTLNYEFMYYILFGSLTLRVIYAPGALSKLLPRVILVLCALTVLYLLSNVVFLTTLWISGALCFYLFRRGMLLKSAGSITAMIFVLLVAGVYVYSIYAMPANRWFTAAYIMLIFYCALSVFAISSMPETLARFLKFIASYSYSMYLIHYAIVFVSYTALKNTGVLDSLQGISLGRLLVVVVIFIVVNIASHLFSLMTEKHTGRARKFLKKTLLSRG